MFDFLRNLTKPAAERRQERLNAYLDGALLAQERRRFENELAEDADLRADLEALRWVKTSVQQLPRVRAPRNFILDPAVYGQRMQQKATWSPYPGLRVATALTAFFFILALALDLATPQGAWNRPLLSSGAPQVALEGSERQADDVAMVTQAEALEEPAADGAAEMAPFAVTAEGEAAEVASEAAEDIVEEEALVAEEPMQEEEPAMPAAGAPEESTERAIEATIPADETDAVADLAPVGTPDAADEAPALSAPQETPAVSELEAGDADTYGEAEAPNGPFSYLLAIEILLGATLVVLAVATLLARRGS